MSLRGVVQSLIEKHFPAPDRDRINRLLGLKPDKPSAQFQAILDEMKGDAAGSSTGKRKPGQSAQPTVIGWYLVIGNMFSALLGASSEGLGRAALWLSINAPQNHLVKIITNIPMFFYSLQ